MKYPILIGTLLLIHSAFSQTQVTLAGKTEIVYPTDSLESASSENVALREIFISKKIAGFGESTHGTHVGAQW